MESTRGGLRTQKIWQLFRFWVLKWVLKWYLPPLKKTLKKHKKHLNKSFLKPSHFRKKWWGNLRPPKIDQHEANKKTLRRALHDTPQHFSVGGSHRWSDHLLPIEPGFCPLSLLPFFAKPVKYTRTLMLSECPLSHPFSNEFSFGLIPFPVRLFVQFHADMSNQINFQ